MNHVGNVNLGIHDFVEFPPLGFALGNQELGCTRYAALSSSRNIVRQGIAPRDLLWTFPIETDQQAQRLHLHPEYRMELTNVQTIPQCL
jgi:hypothetical protein